MTYGVTWHDETEARLREAKAREESLRKEAQRLIREANYYSDLSEAFEKLLKLYGARHENAMKLNVLRENSTWDNLVTIMENNKGFLTVSETVSLFLESNLFDDRESARNAIYSTLYHHKKDLRKIRAGVYQLMGSHSKLPSNQKQTSKKVSRGKTTGIKEIVRSLKDTNPELTKNDILRTLINNGFDFQGKRPKSSVTMAWNSLGYSKEGKQQELIFSSNDNK